MAKRKPFEEYRATTRAERIAVRKEFNQWKKTKHCANWTKGFLKSQFGTCFYCDAVIDLDNRKSYHIEHRVPIYYGGTNELRNLCLACPSCNLTKSTDQLVRDKAFLNRNNYYRTQAQEHSGRPIEPKLYI